MSIIRIVIHVLVFSLVFSADLYSQGVSTGSSADIAFIPSDGEQLPVEQEITFNLGEVKGSFVLTLNGCFTDSEEKPYLSRFQDLMCLYRTTSPSTVDYRHIDETEVLQFIISNLEITEGYSIGFEGVSCRMLEGDMLRFETTSGQQEAINGFTDDFYYYTFDDIMDVSENDTLHIKTISGRWRLQYITMVFVRKTPDDNPLKYIGSENIIKREYDAATFGRFYLKGNFMPDDCPEGLVAFVVDQTGDTIRHQGLYASESVKFQLDLEILRPGDRVVVLMGTDSGTGTSDWQLQLEKKPYYYSSHYSDPEEVPLSLASTLNELEIFANGHPRVFSFRNDYLGQNTYERFYETVVQSQGAAPKTLGEERLASVDNLPKMQRLAEEHPEKVILNHFSFHGPMVERVPETYDYFSKEHWCYHPGTYLTASLAASSNLAVVETTSRFYAPNEDGSAYSNDVVILIPFDSLGNKVWKDAEYAAIISMEDNTLELLRGLFRTKPGDFSGGTYIAPTFTHSGWNLGHDLEGFRGDDTYFFYNWSASCPTDSLGRNCGDAFTALYASYFKEGGIFERFHGVMADVWPGNHSARPLYRSEIYDRHIDYDVDGKADNGFDERGFDLFSYGQYDFARKFRKMLGPDRIWTADGNGANWPRAVPFLSGIESEGFASHHDAFLKGWSGAINRFSYYRNNLQQSHQFNVAVPKILDYEEAFPANIAMHHTLRRLARAATTIMELQNCANGVKTGVQVPDFWLADDYIGGTLNSAQWLGLPVGEIIRPAMDSADLLNGAGKRMDQDFVNRWTSDNAVIIKDGENLSFMGTKRGLGTMQERMSIKCPLQIPEGDLFIRFMVKADSLSAYSSDVPRFFFFTVNGLQSTEWTWPTLEGMAGSYGYEEMTFYYRQAGPAAVSLEIGFEGYENVWISDFTVHNAADVMAREFENGVVLVNPSAESFLFDLDEMFPGTNLKFYKGNEWEEFIGLNNSGLPIQGPVNLNAHRGMFLLKEPGEPNTRVENNSLNDYRIFPVPAEGEFNLDVHSAREERCQVTLFDIHGRKVVSWIKVLQKGDNSWTFDTDGLSGVYVLKVVSDHLQLSEKILIRNTL
jgi:hypothetical protein